MSAGTAYVLLLKITARLVHLLCALLLLLQLFADCTTSLLEGINDA